MFFKKKTEKRSFPYDSSRHIPVLRCSICTGEQTAGFRDRDTGIFHEERLIRNSDDLDEFMRVYGLQDIKKEY